MKKSQVPERKSLKLFIFSNTTLFITCEDYYSSIGYYQIIKPTIKGEKSLL
jgi:hypothetical protein